MELEGAASAAPFSCPRRRRPFEPVVDGDADPFVRDRGDGDPGVRPGVGAVERVEQAGGGFREVAR